MGQVGPLKDVAPLLNQLLSDVAGVAETIRDKAHEINRKVKDTGHIQKLEDAEKKLADFQDKLLAVEGDLYEYQDTVDQTADALDFVGPPLNDLSQGLDQTVAPINVALEAINATYEDIQSEVDRCKPNSPTRSLRR